MTAAGNFITLGETMRGLLDENGKRKEKERKRKEENYSSHDCTNKARNLRVVLQCFWRS